MLFAEPIWASGYHAASKAGHMTALVPKLDLAKTLTSTGRPHMTSLYCPYTSRCRIKPRSHLWVIASNAGGRHQQPCSLIVACQRHQPLLQPSQLFAKAGAGYQQGIGYLLQHCMPADQFSASPLEAKWRRGSHLQSKATKDAAETPLDVLAFTLNQFSCRQDARSSCAGSDLQCTDRNHPNRINCAMPRASLRSVFTRIALKASRTCRVSNSSIVRAASRIPA